ncbi:Protein of unknown function (DUF3365) [Thiovulum sp. ES]|nr:Protein of unknown function (DUF3365) [Thiovulum sp. ES]
MKKILFAVLLTLGANAENFNEIFHTGQNSATTLLKALGGELKAKMKEGNITKAIQFCASNGLPITAKVDEKLGENISIKRISEKNRNPQNVPTEAEAKILKLMEENGSPILTKAGKDTYKYYHPLKIAKPVCLKCHGKGEDMPEQARKTIHSLYPKDKAYGYSKGDLRGAIVVEIRK